MDWFQSVLPVALTSTGGLLLSYRVAKVDYSALDQRFKFSAAYEFLNKDNCGKHQYNRISGLDIIVRSHG